MRAVVRLLEIVAGLFLAATVVCMFLAAGDVQPPWTKPFSDAVIICLAASGLAYGASLLCAARHKRRKPHGQSKIS
ncbi:hypothetical protein OKA05_27875 [Luteolibacter arcticus]|uniref:Uncharacterized protein n=1 Tax=Luteolibacter arcticus TaxID=1581411 RepID=A0ABT3GSB7_9BACT|nr:hypothetical protein [Luteolibacter arcticus]MCW1926402.1 hypothetical protein [Luteolibacter arcticus]